MTDEKAGKVVTGDRKRGFPVLPPGYLCRPRLTRLLDDSPESGIVYVRGPRGSGKSSLVSEWAHREADRGPIAWITANDAPSMIAELSALLTSWDPSTQPDLGPRTSTGHTHDLASGLESELRTIASVIRRLPILPTIVIDDAERAGGAAEVALSELARQSDCRIIVITRRPESSVTAVQRCQVSVETIDAEDLAFTVHEISEIQQQGQDSSLKWNDPEKIHEFTGGHPLLTRIVAGHQGERTGQNLPMTAVALALVPSTLVDFAVLISLVHPISVELAEKITGDQLSADHLSQLSAEGTGAFDSAGLYSFTPLIGNALQHTAHSTITPERIAEVRALAFDHFARLPGYSHIAASMVIETGAQADLWPSGLGTLLDSPTLAQCARRSRQTQSVDAPNPIRRDLRDRLVTIVLDSIDERVPSSTVISTGESLCVEVEQLSRTALVEQLGARGAAPLVSSHSETSIRLLIKALLVRATRAWDESDSTVAEIIRHLGGTLPHGALPSDEVDFWTLYSAAILAAATGSLDLAEEALDAAFYDRHPERRGRCQVHRAFVHAMRGEMHSASALLADVSSTSPELMRNNARCTITAAAIAVESGRPDRARGLLDALTQDLDHIDEWPYALIVLSRAYIQTDAVAGHERLRSLVRQHCRRPLHARVNDLLQSALADLDLAVSDVHAARKRVRGRAVTDVALRLSAARVALVGSGDDSLIDMRSLVEEPSLWPRLRAQAYLLISIHCHRHGKTDEAAEAMTRALTITRTHQIRLILALIPQNDLRAVLAQMPEEDLLQTISTSPLDDVLVHIELTGRETALLRNLASTKVLRKIAEEEFVSLNTIKTQATSLYRKLGVRSRAEAVDAGRRRGLIGI